MRTAGESGAVATRASPPTNVQSNREDASVEGGDHAIQEIYDGVSRVRVGRWLEAIPHKKVGGKDVRLAVLLNTEADLVKLLGCDGIR